MIVSEARASSCTKRVNSPLLLAREGGARSAQGKGGGWKCGRLSGFVA